MLNSLARLSGALTTRQSLDQTARYTVRSFDGISFSAPTRLRGVIFNSSIRTVEENEEYKKAFAITKKLPTNGSQQQMARWMEPFFFFNRRRFFPPSTPELQCGKQACVRSVKNVSNIFNTIHREPHEKKNRKPQRILRIYARRSEGGGGMEIISIHKGTHQRWQSSA